jgi:hypothetical protein
MSHLIISVDGNNVQINSEPVSLAVAFNASISSRSSQFHMKHKVKHHAMKMYGGLEV